MTNRTKALIAASGVVLLALAAYLTLRPDRGKDTLTVSGNIEVTEARLSFKIAGKLEKRLVEEGEEITPGRLVAYLDPADQEIAVMQAEADARHYEAVLAEQVAGSRPEEIAKSEAVVRQKKHALEEMEHGSRVQEVQEAQAELERNQASAKSSEVQLNLAKFEYERYQALFQKGGISEKDYETYKTKLESALVSAREAEARVSAARQRLSLLTEGTRSERIEKSRAELVQAEAELALIKAGVRAEVIDQTKAKLASTREALRKAKQQESYTKLYAPFLAVVFSKHVEPGEYVNAGSPVVTVGELDRVWLRAYVNETEAPRVNLNQECTVTVDGRPGDKFKGRVSFISNEAEFTPKHVQTFRERVKLMYRIKIELENKDRKLKPGMPADAVIKLGS